MLAEASLLDSLNPVFKALADPTRRRILDELRRESLPTGKLATHFQLSRFGVMKHLKVLQHAGLVTVESVGRERWNHVNPAPIRTIYRRWILPFEEEVADRALRLKHHVERSSSMNETAAVGVTNVIVEVKIASPITRVWKALVDETGDWWHRDFSTAPGMQAFTIEPTLGGKVFEDWGNGNGQMWGTVYGFREPNFLQFVGDVSKDWGGPARSIITWRLEESGAETLLRHEHSQLGPTSDKTRSSLETGWQFLLRDCLKPFAETGKAPEVGSFSDSACND